MEATVTKADQSQELLATVTGIGRLISFRGGTRSAPALQPAGERRLLRMAAAGTRKPPIMARSCAICTG